MTQQTQAPSGKLVFYHSPNTRSTATRTLLEELQAPFDLHVLDMKRGANREPAYLAVNPLGKVPAIVHNGALVTESVAVFIYLADAFASAGLAPPIGHPDRGPYLRWMIYYGSCFEPAVVDRAQKREPAPIGMSPYGDFDSMLKTVTDRLAQHPYLVGDSFTAADLLWGSGLGWTTGFGIVPKLPVIEAYIARVSARPAVQRVKALDEALSTKLAEQA